MKYRISTKALRDIEKIWCHTFEHWSLKQADKYHDLIFEEMEHIAINFDSGKDFGKFRKGYKYSQVKSSSDIL